MEWIVASAVLFAAFIAAAIMYARASAENASLKARLGDMPVHFRAESAAVIKAQSDEFSKTLSPLKEQIKDFHKSLTDMAGESKTQAAVMRGQIEKLEKMNASLTKEAADLADALKGNKKLQGNWGELQLERLFEILGFKEGREYQKQKSFATEDGRQQPDYILNLPDNRRVVIDCKISLNNYVKYMQAEDDAQRMQHLRAHVDAVKKHLKGLGNKDYQRLIKESSLDYVFMFMPIEHAYIEAIGYDGDLYAQAFESGVAIATPSSLFPILRTIDSLWKAENRNKNVQRTAELGAILYEKLVGFTNDMEDIDRNLKRAQNSYDEAYKKLATGRGNALSVAEKMKTVGGIATDKKLLVEHDGEE